jgi:four helix bundle protein
LLHDNLELRTLNLELKVKIFGRAGIGLANKQHMAKTPPDFCPRSFAFACDIVRLYRALEKAVPPALARQVLRSGTSIGANLEEAKVAQSRRDLTAKFSIALKEARETSYWLRLLTATSLARPDTVGPCLREANELVSILTTSVRSLKAEKNGNNVTRS